jgi:hypothetical protein
MSTYIVVDDYLCVLVGECTCTPTLSARHHRDCAGLEPILKVETLLAEQAVNRLRVRWSVVYDLEEIERINEELHGYGIDYPQGSAGVHDLVVFAKRDARIAKIADKMVKFLHDNGHHHDAEHFEKEIEDA